VTNGCWFFSPTLWREESQTVLRKRAVYAPSVRLEELVFVSNCAETYWLFICADSSKLVIYGGCDIIFYQQGFSHQKQALTHTDSLRDPI